MNILEERDWRQKSELVAIRNLLGCKVDMSWSDSIMVKYSAV
jgi:hypothetical protein